MINLLVNMNRIDLQPAFTAEEYGAFHLDLAQYEFADEMDALEDSESPTKTGFADYISDLALLGHQRLWVAHRRARGRCVH